MTICKLLQRDLNYLISGQNDHSNYNSHKLTLSFDLPSWKIDQINWIHPELDCMASGGFISFELITGYVLSAPAELMLMQPGTIQLTECLNICRQNSSCLAINFETGLCVLLQDSADRNPQALQKSQFPVFTIYAHKICLQGKFYTHHRSRSHLFYSW